MQPQLFRDRSEKVGFYGLDLYSLRASMEAVLRYLERVDPDAAKQARARYACFDHFSEMQSAGMTPVKGDLRGLVRARRLSWGTMRNIRQNLFFAFIYNTLGVPIAAGVLYLAWGLFAYPTSASDIVHML